MQIIDLEELNLVWWFGLKLKTNMPQLCYLLQKWVKVAQK